MKLVFKELKKFHFQHIQERAAHAQKQLQELQQFGLREGVLDENYKQIKKHATQLAKAEFSFYLQCAQNKYFKQVDRNTIFFHSLVRINNRRRKIMVVEKQEGETTTILKEIIDEFLQAFQNQLGTCPDKANFQSACL